MAGLCNPRVYKLMHGQQVEGGYFALCSHNTPLRVLCPAMEPPVHKRHGVVKAHFEEGYKDDQKAGIPLL